jgi:hypothetical protein
MIASGSGVFSVFARGLAIAVVVMSLALSGCGKHDKVAAVVAPEQKPAAAASEVDVTETANTTCAEGDIACEERIYQLEETLLAYEAGAAKKIGEGAQSCWKADSEAFRKTVDSCKNMACKEEALLARLSSLNFLQSEDQRASLELPPTPILLAVLAPDSDPALGPASASEPAVPDAKLLFEVRGSLIHAREHPEHMGIAVSRDQKDHVFIFDMDIGNQSAEDEIMGLVGASPTVQVLVRGQKVVAPTGVENFDPGQCRWVYEVP